MNANEFGKRLGIGVRVAGRIAQQRAAEAAKNQAGSQTEAHFGTGASQPRSAKDESAGRTVPSARELREKSHKLTRAAGRGVGGFLRPFGRVGGILWLEVTGFFFALFALYFAVDMWRARLSYAVGPQHARFLIAAGLTAVFAYLAASAFWRAGRK